MSLEVFLHQLGGELAGLPLSVDDTPAISPEPVWITGFIALINTLAVAGCYLLTSRWFGLGPAIVASMLFALNPWAVIFSRKIWHANFTALFLPLLY